MKDIHQTFDPFKGHPAIKTMHRMLDHKFTFSAPVEFVLHMTEPPEFRIRVPLTPALLQRVGGEKNANDFISALTEFYTDSHFQKFYDAHRSYYETVQRNVMSTIGGTNLYDDFLEKFFGVAASYQMILSTVFPYHNYGPSVGGGNERVYYNVNSPTGVSVSNGIPVYSKGQIENTLIHEFSHSHVNPLVDQYDSEFQEVSCLYEPVRAKMTQNNYATWNNCLNEHFVRAIVAVFLRENYGEKRAEMELRNQNDMGFIYINEAYQLDLEYLKNRSQYKNYGDFFPQIVSHFRNMPCPKN